MHLKRHLDKNIHYNQTIRCKVVLWNHFLQSVGLTNHSHHRDPTLALNTLPCPESVGFLCYMLNAYQSYIKIKKKKIY